MAFLERLLKHAEADPSAFFAPGLPVKGRMRAIPSFSEPRTLFFGEQFHNAARSGAHTDFRISDGRTAFSWAVRKGIPAPGQIFLAARQSDHSPSYVTWSGKIDEPYGRGRVKLVRSGSVKVDSSSPEKISFTLLDSQNPQKLTLIHAPKYGENRWLLANHTPTVKSRPDVVLGKPRYKEKSPEDLGRFLGDRFALTSKIDGAQVLVHMGDRVEIFSHRPSKKGELINHTYLLGADELDVPAGLKGTALRAELFAVKGSKVAPIQTLGGLMNSSPEKALQKMEDENIRLYVAPFQVLSHRGEGMSDYSYREQLKVLNQIISRLPENWVLPDIALTPKQKEEMTQRIQKGKHPLTREGVVAWPMDEVAAMPTKLKFRDHDQVYLEEVYPMTQQGKQVPLAGGFTYRMTPKGPVLGRVGTGFTMKLRKELWENRKELKGQRVIIESAGQFPEGAFRAPSFVSFHL